MRVAPAVLLLLAALAGAEATGQDPAVIVRAPLDAADGRWHQVATVADGVLGAAARFADPKARIDLGPCPATAEGPFTLRCAIRCRDGSFSTPLMARDGGAVGLSLVIGRQPGHLSFEAWSWQSVRLLSRHRIDDGHWHRIEVSYDPQSNGALLFIDGELHSHGVLGRGGSPTARLRLGNNIGAHQPFAGDIDEVEVIATTTQAAMFGSFRPVLSEAARVDALTSLRARVLPHRTPSLSATAANDWNARRQHVRRRVADALGLQPAPADVPFEVEVHGELKRPGLRLQRVSWIGFPGMRATGWLWSPDPQPAGRLPTVLCPHGHFRHGARDPVIQARCAAFARFGWLALAVDSVHVEDVAAGVNAIGAMTWHNQRALGWLLERDDVDPARVAVTGASGGGQQTYYLMALEDRLAAAAPIVMACYWGEIISDTSAHCGCNHPPGLAASTDVPEMCAVFAPRPAFFGSVTGDWTRNFPRQGLPELTAHWRRLGAPGPRSRHADEDHNYDRMMREAVYGFLHDVLAGPAKDGRVRGHVAEPEGAIFALEELQPLRAARPQAQLDRRAMAREYRQRRRPIAALNELATGLTFDVARLKPRWLDADSAEWRRGTVTGPDGVPIPLRLQSAADTSGPGFTVVVHPGGATMALAEGLQRFAGGGRLALVDPRPYGEWRAFRSAWQRNGLLLGRGEGYQAAIDVAQVCASLPGDAPVRVIGLGEAGVVALLAAHLSQRIRAVLTEDLGRPYADDGNRLPLCPGLLRLGDLPVLVERLPAGVSHRVLTAGR